MKFWQKKMQTQKQQNKNEQAAAEMETFLPWLILYKAEKNFSVNMEGEFACKVLFPYQLK